MYTCTQTHNDYYRVYASGALPTKVLLLNSCKISGAITVINHNDLVYFICCITLHIHFHSLKLLQTANDLCSFSVRSSSITNSYTISTREREGEGGGRGRKGEGESILLLYCQNLTFSACTTHNRICLGTQTDTCNLFYLSSLANIPNFDSSFLLLLPTNNHHEGNILVLTVLNLGKKLGILLVRKLGL